ncbi:MAG: hypothetical protein ABSG92_06245 [Conexivisphaerales archaeon]|jgi:hypothetical protein
MRFTKTVWALSTLVGVAATYALSYVPTLMLFPVAGVQQYGLPAPVYASQVFSNASLDVVPAGIIVDVLFWFVVSVTVLSVAADRKKPGLAKFN